ncbi:MAG: FkbM family methyltransferase [Roseiflexaceae bacterium]
MPRCFPRLDDFVANQQLEKTYYIKLDIEESELVALEGARHLITIYRPKIAMCLYSKTATVGKYHSIYTKWYLNTNSTWTA